MDVWWGGLLPAPEDYGKDPRIEQLADLKRQLEAANKMVASLTPKAVDKVAGRVTADVSLDGRPAKQLDFDAPRADPGASVSVARALPGFLLEGKTALVLGDHAEASRALSASFAGLGARVAAGDLNAAATGTWVHALATAASGTVTHVDLPSPSRGQPNAHHSQTAPRPVGAPSASLAKDGTGVDVAVLVVSSPGMNRRSQADGDGDLALVSSQLGAARSVVAGVAPGMRLRRWGRVVVVTVTGPQGDEAGEVLAGACNALVRSWGTEFGGCGLTCNSVNVTAGPAGPAGGDGGGVKAGGDWGCLVGPTVMLATSAGAGVNGAALPVSTTRRG